MTNETHAPMTIWQTLVAICTITGFIAATTAWLFKKVVPTLRKWSRRADRVFGTPEDPATNTPATPSIFDHLTAQDATLATQNETLARMEEAVNRAVQQVQNSHVTNLRDDVDEVIGKVDALHDKLDEHLKPPAT